MTDQQLDFTDALPLDTGVPIIASPSDINAELASRAFNGTSFTPEKRGEQRQREYADEVNGFYAELWPKAKTDEQKALLAEEMERYRQGYIKHMTAYLHSHSNVVSAFIAGPSKFPVARMQKRGQWADNKANDLLEWRTRARQAIQRKLMDARPQEVKDAAEWNALARDIAGSLGVIKEIDEGHSPYTRSAFVNSIVGKVERLAHNDEVELVTKALQFVTEYNERHKKPAISSRHKFWTLATVAEQARGRLTVNATQEPEVIAHAEGVEIVVNPQADRVQIIFAAKPSVEIIGKLKAEAWNWSPREGAWQRKLTEAAKYSAKRVTGLL
ncbi:MAG: hypothetical protein SGI88_03590 [Candidatus Hydrogenedentes bacterium]|nr:hypothetical protein [Candidatus Hydrogenedentota bacterium]